MNKMMLVLALWAALLLGGGLPAAATKAVPQNSGDTLCVAPLTVEGVALFNQTLERFGHYDMTVVGAEIDLAVADVFGGIEKTGIFKVATVRLGQVAGHLPFEVTVIFIHPDIAAVV